MNIKSSNIDTKNIISLIKEAYDHAKLDFTLERDGKVIDLKSEQLPITFKIDTHHSHTPVSLIIEGDTIIETLDKNDIAIVSEIMDNVNAEIKNKKTIKIQDKINWVCNELNKL